MIYFEVVTTFALVIGLIVANVIKPGAGVAFTHSANTQVNEISSKTNEINWGDFFSHIVPANIFDAFAKGNILQILFFSVLFAVGLKALGSEGERFTYQF